MSLTPQTLEKSKWKEGLKVFATYLISSGIAASIVGLFTNETVAVIGAIATVALAIGVLVFSYWWPTYFTIESPILGPDKQPILKPLLKGWIIVFAWIAAVGLLAIVVAW